ncbi:hypothetical protein LTR06_004959 [Exophiala xenobiotica]|nr:hypothetical protein LTR06_004959 [Exophiala xenobiotica]
MLKPIHGPYLLDPLPSRADQLRFLKSRFNLWPIFQYTVKKGSPVSKAYDEICNHICSIADDPEFKTTNTVHHTLCLVGPREDKLRPAIAIHSPCPDYRSRVAKRIKESSEWRSFVSRHPLFILLKSPKAPQTLGMHKETDSWFVYTPEPASLGIGSPLCFASKDDPGEFIHMATAGPILSLGGEPYLLIPSHPILLRQSQTSDQGTHLEVDDYCEIDYFDNESSESPNLSTSGDNDLADSSSTTNNACAQATSPWHDTNASTTQAQPRISLHPFDNLVGEVQHTSSTDETAQHDWALCKIRPWVYKKMVSSGRVNVVHNVEGVDSISVREVAKPQEHSITAILVSSLDGGHAGTLSTMPSYYRMAGSQTSLEVLTFQTDISLSVGACGSPIIDATNGLWYGQIIAGEVDAPIAYVLPAINIVGDITRELEISELIIDLMPTTGVSRIQTSMATSSRGLYQPLPDNSIRLLKMHPPGRTSRFSFSQVTTSLTGEHKYAVVSYTSGGSVGSGPVMVDGHEIHVSPELASFLNFSSRLESLDGVDLWVEALCVNQADVLERNSQVQRMAEIYRKAEVVIAWLGEPDQSSYKAVGYMLQGLTQRMNPLTYDDDRIEDLGNLLTRPWWWRTSVIQELMCARRLELSCGSTTFEWSSFLSWFAAYTLFNASQNKEHGSVTKLPGLFGGSNTRWSQLLREVLKMQAGIVQSMPMSLESLLCQTTLTNCDDPRDRIYSLLGLSSTPTVLEIDYGKSSHDLYVDVVVSLIASSESLDIICRSWAPRVFLKHEQLPSWIPIIPHEGYEPIFTGPADLRRAPDMLVGLPEGRRKYSACGGFGVYTALSRDGGLDSGLDIYLQGPGDGLGDNVAYMDSGSPATYIRESVAMQFACPVKYCGKTFQGQYSESSNLVRHLRESHLRDQEALHKVKAWRCFSSACTLRTKVLTGYDSFRHHVLHKHPTEDVTLLITKSLRWFQLGARQALIAYRHTLPMLKVRGILISRLEDIRDRAVGGVIPSSWRELGGWPDVQKKPPESFWRTLVADRGHNHANCPPYYAEACQAVFQLARAGADLHTLTDVRTSSPFLRDYVSRMQAVVEGRHLALTQVRGAEGKRDVPRLAVVPGNTKRGDFVAVLYGCSVPVVLRQVEGAVTEGAVAESADAEKQREYQLIGECYVHGMMNGEALDLADLSEDEREMLLV